MKLISNDYQNIANQIEVGSGSIEYIKGNETLFVEYTYEEEGYIEDDARCGYMNGTGAYVVTDRFLSVEVESYDEEGEQTANDFIEGELYKMVA